MNSAALMKAVGRPMLVNSQLYAVTIGAFS